MLITLNTLAQLEWVPTQRVKKEDIYFVTETSLYYKFFPSLRYGDLISNYQENYIGVWKIVDYAQETAIKLGTENWQIIIDSNNNLVFQNKVEDAWQPAATLNVNNFITNNINVTQQIIINNEPVVLKNREFKVGNTQFFNTKKIKVNFDLPFEKLPKILLTQNDNSALNPFIKIITKEHFIIEFLNNWTGNIDWVAVEIT